MDFFKHFFNDEVATNLIVVSSLALKMLFVLALLIKMTNMKSYQWRIYLSKFFIAYVWSIHVFCIRNMSIRSTRLKLGKYEKTL